MTSKEWKRQKVGVLAKASKSVLVVSGSCLGLIGQFLSLGEFLRWRSTCMSILLCTRDRFSRWQQYNHVFSNDERLQSLCSDMYGFLTSKLDAPDYYDTRPDYLPSFYFPDPRQVARASISMVAPDVLLRVPLRLLNALSGIDSLAHLPCSPLLDHHFVPGSRSTESLGILTGTRDTLFSSTKLLAFSAHDFNSPITVCYNAVVTVIVFRTLSSPFGCNHGTITLMWYTCLNPLEWWCEFSKLPGINYFYDIVHVSDESTHVAQIAQFPPSGMSFLRPYLRGGRSAPFIKQPGYFSASKSHATVWVAMENLETLVAARAVTHVSIAHHESFVRLADDVFPPVEKQLRLVLDWAHTQIQLPLLFPTMPISWSPETALASALRHINGARPEEEWDLQIVPMGVYRELCDDVSFPLSDRDVLKRLPVLREHFLCPIMQALHSLFSKGNRGLRPRISEHAVQCLANAANILSHQLYSNRVHPDTTRRHKVLHRRHIPELFALFHEVASQENNDFIAPSQVIEGFRTHEVLLFEACRLDSSFFHPMDIEDAHFEATGEPSPEFMCNICSCKHHGNQLQANQTYASTHATRARILLEKHFQTKHFHSRDQPTLCLLDPSFPQQLESLFSQAEASDRPLTVSVNVPAYHLEDSVRGAQLNRLAVTHNLTTDNLRELSADRYYLHSVGLVLEPDMRVCFVCDINQAGSDYEYIDLGHGE
jgi:hypothetical protein